MMEKKELRSADFISAILLILFGLWVLITTLTTFPMKDSWGGVQNVWYVSPALFPLFISFGITVLGIVLLRHAIKTGGAKTFLGKLAHIKPGLSENMLRFLSIVLIFVALVYIYIPRNDFFLSALLCLTVFMSMYYLDRADLLKKLTGFFLIGTLIFLLLAIFNMNASLNNAYIYLSDILVFVFYLSYLAYAWKQLHNEDELKKKFSLTLLISFAVPLFVVPLFKYALLVPFPTEGGAIELMNIFWYSPTIKAVRKVTGPYILLLGVFLVFVAAIVVVYFKFLREPEKQQMKTRSAKS